MSSPAWWQDFKYSNGVVHVKKTGIDVPVEPGVVHETLIWLAFWARIELARRSVRADGPAIWFTPDRPRPWYLIWPVLQLAGLRLAATPEAADLGFHFEDRTRSATPSLPTSLGVLNGACLDVSKTRVGAVYEQVFGRALSLDPSAHDGPMVRKSEGNGVHDGSILTGPVAREPGWVYQRLIDNRTETGLVEDLRCPTVGGEIPVVFIKRREETRRFANANAEVVMTEPGAVERVQLSQFCRAMGLDWGGLDVLRDRSDGALYVVDVNKTDMGPPIALPLREKMDATRRLARALRALAERVSQTREAA